MIISKDLFIFGEQIFATIIPESGASPTAQQQQQLATTQQQQHQQLPPQDPVAIINTTTTAFTTDIAAAAEILPTVNTVDAITTKALTTKTKLSAKEPKSVSIAFGAADASILVDAKSHEAPKEVKLNKTQYSHSHQQLQQQQPQQQQQQQMRTRSRESQQQKSQSGSGENGCSRTNKLTANQTGKRQQQLQREHLLNSFSTAATVTTKTTTANTPATGSHAATSVIIQLEEEKKPLMKRNFAKIIAKPLIAGTANAGTATGCGHSGSGTDTSCGGGKVAIAFMDATATAAIELVNQTKDFATHEVTPLLPLQQHQQQQQLHPQSQQQLEHTIADQSLQLQLQLHLPATEEGAATDDLPSALNTTTIAATSDRGSYDTTTVAESPFAGHNSSLNSDEDLPSLTTTTTTTATMSKVILGNNTSSDQTMSTFPFISDTETHHRMLQLSFQNINVLHNERQILSDVSGSVRPGEVLAVMGPSGSGKTTLLDCLSGQRRFDSGGVYLNREPLSKKWRRKICYVLQEEIFFSGLTLRETVMYTALLRLPEKMPKSEKIQLVDRILEALELTFCQHTKFGDYLNRGLSGGEKKRANIACELLTNPLLMLLDEPTSGLDSHSAISLMKFLKRYAVQEQKTVVITVHQPSSQMFHMFDKLLLLYNGRTAYFGEVNNIYTYFESIGVAIKPHYNPADFVLEQLKSFPKIREKLFIAAKESHGNYLNRNCITVNTNNQRNQQHHSNNANNHQLHIQNNGEVHCDTANTMSHISSNTTTNSPTTTTEIVHEKPLKHDALINDIINNYYKDIHNNHTNHISHDAMLIMSDHQNSNEEASQQLWYGHDSQSNSSATSSDCHRYESCGDTDWLDYPTSFHTQFCVLSSRNFKEAKPRMLSKLNWFQTIGLALMAGSIWFQIPRTEEFLHDLQGWMFFSQTYWMLFALFGALNSFPAEREVISKERRSGAYRLSAYYLAKMFGELPLVVTLPTVYLMISYPMLGCTSFKLFSLMLVFLLLNTIVAQSVGFFIGACCMDMNVSITLSALYTLATQLFGGYLSTRIPEGLSWIRYTSMIHYAYQNMQILEFREGPAISCGNPSSFEFCKTDGTITATTTTTFIPYEEILKAQNSTSPLWLNTLVLMMFFVVFRCLGYAVLRYVRCPKT